MSLEKPKLWGRTLAFIWWNQGHERVGPTSRLLFLSPHPSLALHAVPVAEVHDREYSVYKKRSIKQQEISGEITQREELKKVTSFIKSLYEHWGSPPTTRVQICLALPSMPKTPRSELTDTIIRVSSWLPGGAQMRQIQITLKRLSNWSDVGTTTYTKWVQI